MELDEEVDECLLVPFVMVPGRTRARERLLLDRDSIPSSFLRPSSRYVANISLYFCVVSASFISSRV